MAGRPEVNARGALAVTVPASSGPPVYHSGMEKKPKKGANRGSSLPAWMPDNLRQASPAKSPSGKHAGSSAKPAGKPAKGGKPGKPAKPGKPGPAAKSSLPAGLARAAGKPPRGHRRVDPHAAREALKYAQPIISREALIELLEEAPGPMTVVLNFVKI